MLISRPDDAGAITRLDPADSRGDGPVARPISRSPATTCPTSRRQSRRTRWPGCAPVARVAEEALLAWDGDRVSVAASCLLPQAENLSWSTWGWSCTRGTGATASAPGCWRRSTRPPAGTTGPDRARDGPGTARRRRPREAGYRYLRQPRSPARRDQLRSRCQLADRWRATRRRSPRRQARGRLLAGAVARRSTRRAASIDVAALQGRLMLDAPTGDLAVEQSSTTSTGYAARGDRTGSRPPLLLDGGAARRDRPDRRPHQTVVRADRDSHARQRVPIVSRTAEVGGLGLIGEVGRPCVRTGARAGAARHRRVERRGEHPHARGQRDSRLPAGGRLVGLQLRCRPQSPQPGDADSDAAGIEAEQRRCAGGSPARSPAGWRYWPVSIGGERAMLTGKAGRDAGSPSSRLTSTRRMSVTLAGPRDAGATITCSPL